jgi:hypothetical protein
LISAILFYESASKVVLARIIPMLTKFFTYDSRKYLLDVK